VLREGRVRGGFHLIIQIYIMYFREVRVREGGQMVDQMD